jgi:hypothetical protein
MELKYIFPDQDKVLDILLHQDLHHIAVEKHDVVVERIIPLTQHLNYTVLFFITAVKYLGIKGFRTKFIPLGVDIVIINDVGKLELTVLPVVKRGTVVLRSDIKSSPIVVWFDVVHQG